MTGGDNSTDFGRLGFQLQGVPRCPHCGIANPQLHRVWESANAISTADGTPPSRWNAHACTSCGGVVLAKGKPGEKVANPPVVEIFPNVKTAASELPDAARRFLQQAYESLHAPDAAAVMAGSAVDAMLKEKGYEDGSLYSRIDHAVRDNLLTEGMGQWAHAVRLGSNRPRHADTENPHVTREEARLAVDFAEAIGNFLFVLTARIEKGLEDAKRAGS